MMAVANNSNKLISTIKQDIDLVEYIGQFVNLEKKGKSYLGLCPFHNEKTPSFHVNPEYRVFNCFGCNKSGSIIDFVAEYENKTTKQAIEHLAKHIGIEAHIGGGEETPESQMIQMHDFVTKMYHHVLVDTREGEQALNYLLKRGFSVETIKKEMMGLAPEKPKFTVELLEKRGMNLELAFRAGLIGRSDNQNDYYDKFRARIMIPIKNHQGDFIGFTARTLGNDHPKYINTSETNIFKKQQILFNLSDARKAIAEARELIMMEGHLDVVKVKASDVRNVVGLMGTALSDIQVETIQTVTDNVTLMLDGDDAGRSAQTKYGERLLKQGLNVYVLPMPDGMDPDDYIEQNGQEKFKYFVRNGKIHYVKYLADMLIDDSLSNDIRFNENIRHIKKMLGLVKDQLTEHRLIESISELYKISPDLLQTERRQPQNYAKQQPVTPPVSTHLFSRHSKEIQLLNIFLKNPDLINQNRDEITADIFTSDVLYAIFKKLVFYHERHETVDFRTFLEELENHEQQELLNINALRLNGEVNQSIIDDYILDLSGIRNSRKEKERISEQLRAAYQAADIDEVKRLTEQYRAISARHKN